jgi:hypothetical protein
MNRIFSTIALSAIALAATPALARELLPLQRGFYVATDTSCREASDATITLYNGASFGQAHAQCRRWSAEQQADGTFQVRKSCRDAQSARSRWQTRTETYQIVSRTEFVETNEFGQFRSRYCKQADLPSDWRVVNLGKGAE